MNWQNSDFQIAFFIVGKCATVDEAYRVLCSQIESREVAVEAAHAVGIEERMAKAERTFANGVEIRCFRAALHELEFMYELKRRLEPHRKYAHLPDEEAHQLAQSEEWLYTLVRRAENMLMAQGMIPWDHFEAMRLHPAYSTVIEPRINQLILAGRGNERIPLTRTPLEDLRIREPELLPAPAQPLKLLTE